MADEIKYERREWLFPYGSAFILAELECVDNDWWPFNHIHIGTFTESFYLDFDADTEVKKQNSLIALQKMIDVITEFKNEFEKIEVKNEN